MCVWYDDVGRSHKRGGKRQGSHRTYYYEKHEFAILSHQTIKKNSRQWHSVTHEGLSLQVVPTSLRIEGENHELFILNGVKYCFFLCKDNKNRNEKAMIDVV